MSRPRITSLEKTNPEKYTRLRNRKNAAGAQLEERNCINFLAFLLACGRLRSGLAFPDGLFVFTVYLGCRKMRSLYCPQSKNDVSGWKYKSKERFVELRVNVRQPFDSQATVKWVESESYIDFLKLIYNFGTVFQFIKFVEFA